MFPLGRGCRRRPTSACDLLGLDLSQVSCLLCDEVQFFSAHHVRQLRLLATRQNVPVICYGLRTDYRGELFGGTAALLALADSIEEVKTTCTHCNKKAIMNLKLGPDSRPPRATVDQTWALKTSICRCVMHTICRPMVTAEYRLIVVDSIEQVYAHQFISVAGRTNY